MLVLKHFTAEVRDFALPFTSFSFFSYGRRFGHWPSTRSAPQLASSSGGGGMAEPSILMKLLSAYCR